jgi:hypothetical protein
MKKSFCALLIILCLVCLPARGESPAGLAVAPVNNDMEIVILCRVDVLPDAAFCADAMRGVFPFSGNPGAIMDLFLYDGWHICHGWWEYDPGGFLSAAFPLGELWNFDSTVGIYLAAAMIK